MLAIALTAVLAASTPFDVGVDSGFGERQVTVSAPGELESSYSHAFGSLRVRLADAAIPPGTTALEVSVAFGELTIEVPAGVGVRVTATTVFGSAEVFDEEFGGFGADQVTTTPGYDAAARRLDLTVNTAFGSTRVRQ